MLCDRCASLVPMIRSLLVMLIFCAAVQAGVLDDWRPLELQATTPEARASVAREMVKAARHARTDIDKLALAQRAYELGAQQPQGHRWAAKALDLIQRGDPAKRIWCLEQLRDMYADAARRHRREPKYTAALGDALVQLTEQRLLNIDSAIEAGNIDSHKAVSELEQAAGDAQLAMSTFKRASTLAKAESRRLQRREPNRSNDMLALAGVLEDQASDSRKLQREVGKRKHMWNRMVAAQERFTKANGNATRDQAEQLALIYVTDFDRPELIPADVHDRLSETIKRHIADACRPVEDLSADQASRLAKWYDQLARKADPKSRPEMLLRTRLYYKKAQLAGDEVARIMLVRVDQDLARNDLPIATAKRKAQELAARLRFLFGKRPVEIAKLPDTTNTSPDVVNPATEIASATQPAAKAASTSGGRFARPVVTCGQCGRKFFPGWGKTAKQCSRCQSGHRNIFDFRSDDPSDPSD